MNEQIYEGWIPLNKRSKLSFGHILAIASCNVIAGNIYNIVFIYLEPFETLLDIGFIARALILLMGSLIGFTITLIIGFYSDRIMLQFGRRRIFIIVGLFFALISLLLMIYCFDIVNFFNPDYKSKTAARIIFIIGVILALASANTIQLPARVLCSDVCPHSQLNLMANACQAYNGAAPLITNVFGFIVFYYFANVRYDSFSLLLISLSIAFAASVISVISTHEEPLYIHPPKTNILKQISNSLKKMPKPFSRVIPVYFFANLAVYQFIFSFSDFVLSELLDDTEKNDVRNRMGFSLLCSSMNNFVQLIYGFCNYKICELIGMRWTMFIGSTLLTVTLAMFLVVTKKYAYIAFSGIIGISTVIYMAIPAAIVSMVIPSEELGINFGILNCFCVLAQQVSNFVMGVGLEKIFNISSGKKIGYSFVFGICAMIASFWIVEPTTSLSGNYTQIQEESKTTDNADRSFIY